MKRLVLYIHGKDGSAGEDVHYRPLFPGCEVTGLDYRSATPWGAGKEIRDAAERLKGEYGRITLIANSIGAYFSMNAGIDGLLDKAYFISPVVDMERLILELMNRAGVTEERLRELGVISTAFGEELSWAYLRFAREHSVTWKVPTEILYGEGDTLTPYETVAAFAKAHGAGLTVMKKGEHWFRTQEQMRFLDGWIKRSESGEGEDT